MQVYNNRLFLLNNNRLFLLNINMQIRKLGLILTEMLLMRCCKV